MEPKIGSFYRNRQGYLEKILSIECVECSYPINTQINSYTLDGKYLIGRESSSDLDLTKEYDEKGNLLIDHNIDISKIPTVDDQKKFTEDLNEKIKNPLLRQEGGSHYQEMAIQPIDFILKNKIGYAEGNVIKYVSRWKKKDGIKDLKKALHVLQILIYEEENKEIKNEY